MYIKYPISTVLYNFWGNGQYQSSYNFDMIKSGPIIVTQTSVLCHYIGCSSICWFTICRAKFSWTTFPHCLFNRILYKITKNLLYAVQLPVIMIVGILIQSNSLVF